MPGLRTAATVLGIVIGLIGLSIDFSQMIPSALVASDASPLARPLPDALIWFWTYFTHLTNLGLVLVYVAVLTRWRWLSGLASPRWMALTGGYILLVMIYYHVMLSGRYVLEGPLFWATIILHYVAPLYYLGWWALFAPHGGLRFAEIGWMLVPGFAYVAWALLRGALTNEYPYDILDAGKNGYGAVAIGVGILVVMVTIFCAAMIFADKLLARATKPAAAE